MSKMIFCKIFISDLQLFSEFLHITNEMLHSNSISLASCIPYLSCESSSGGGEVDLSNNGEGIRGNLRVGVSRGQEEAELFIVVDRLLTNLNHKPGTYKTLLLLLIYLTVLKLILFQVAITTCMLNKCMNFAPWPWDTRSPRSNGYRIGSTPSTSCIIKVFPNLTANSRAVVKLAS